MVWYHRPCLSPFQRGNTEYFCVYENGKVKLMVLFTCKYHVRKNQQQSIDCRILFHKLHFLGLVRKLDSYCKFLDSLTQVKSFFFCFVVSYSIVVDVINLFSFTYIQSITVNTSDKNVCKVFIRVFPALAKKVSFFLFQFRADFRGVCVCMRRSP